MTLSSVRTPPNTDAPCAKPCLADHGVVGSLIGMRRELFTHALRLTKSQSLAEDLVQDTIERAIRFEYRFERGTNLRAWVHQILANLFYSRCRQQRRESRAIACLNTDPCAWTAREPSADAPVADLSQATRRALGALPSQFQSTVVMVDLMDMSYRAAADRLGVPLGTVMSRLHRGRRLLADALREQPTVREAA
jgi:RNA polymerase sigma-70 factor, ECF subfamily